MVQLLYTPKLEQLLAGLDLPIELQDLVKAQLKESQLSSSSAEIDSISSSHKTLSHEVLVRISKCSRQDRDKAPCSLNSMLATTNIYTPGLPPRDKSPELLAILAKIQLDQDRTSYEAMTSTAEGPQFRSLLPMKDLHDPNRPESTSTEAEDWELVRKQVSAIANVLASMFAVGTGVWWVGGGRTYAARLVLALTGAVAIAVIEGFLYYRFFTREKGQIGSGRTKTRPLRMNHDHARLLGATDGKAAKVE